MRVDFFKNDQKVLSGRLWDLDEDKEILNPIWFDLEKGLFEAYQTTPFGRIKRTPHGKLTYLAKGRIRYDAKRETPTQRRISGSQKCQGCSRQAQWQVGDETPLDPVRKGNWLFTRAATVGVRFYCDRCYKAPRILDAKGEVMETIEDAGGARPQWHS